MSILDEFPYPWAKPTAQLLHRRLAENCPSPKAARDLVAKVPAVAGNASGIDVLRIDFDGDALTVWARVLDAAARARRVRALAQFVHDDDPFGAIATFLADLLAEKEPLADPEPRGQNGKAVFDDKIRAKESLLFFHDLTEGVAEVTEILDATRRALAWAPAVCRLRVELAGGWTGSGTGFRIGADLVLTNHHVLFPNGQSPVRITADFGYELDANKKPLTVTSLAGDVGTLRAEEADDWGVVRVAGLDPSIPIVPVDGALAVVGERAYIVQHPGGDYKRLGFVRNRVVEVAPRTVLYLTDTTPGASGSPVFNAKGALIALHHAGGTPQSTPGGDPAQKNEGIRIDCVLERLRANGVL